MPTKPVTTIPQQLNAAQLAIVNSLADPEIKAAVAQYGYTTAKLNAGKALYDKALAAVNAQKSGKGGQKTATADLKAAEKEARVSRHRARTRPTRLTTARTWWPWERRSSWSRAPCTMPPTAI